MKAILTIVVLVSSALAQSVTIGGGVRIGGGSSTAQSKTCNTDERMVAFNASTGQFTCQTVHDAIENTSISPSAVAAVTGTFTQVNAGSLNVQASVTTGSAMTSDSNNLCLNSGQSCILFVDSWPSSCANGSFYIGSGRGPIPIYGIKQCQNSVLADLYQATPTEPPTQPTDNFYVSTAGSDTSGDGSLANPWKTITAAALATQCGKTLIAKPGTYHERVDLNNVCTSDAKLTVKCENDWACKITTTADQGYYHVGIGGQYVNFEGFEVNGLSGTNTAGIGIDVFGSHNTVRRNHVYNLITTDCTGTGGLVGITNPWNGIDNIGKTYNVFEGNLIHDIHCHLYKGDGTDGSSTKSGAGIYVGDFYTTVRNNIIYNVGSYGIQLNHYVSNNEVVNNTVIAARNTSGGAAINMGCGGETVYNIVSDYNVISNNIAINSNYGIQGYPSSSGCTFGTHNVWSNNVTWNNTNNIVCKTGVTCPADTNGVHSDPLFVRYAIDGSGDFRLQANSPAKSTGTATNAPTTDFAGTNRSTTAPSRGAYE